MINWGFLGAGWVATKALAPAVHKARNGKLFAVASRDHNRAAALSPEKIYGSYEDLLADPKIDAVYINLANHQHFQWTVAALAAGKNVLCEKPLALNFTQAQAMADAAHQHKRVLTEAVCNQWHPRFRRIVELVSHGDVGAITAINSAFTFSAQNESNYRSFKEMGGGSFLDVGIYQAHNWSALIKGELNIEIESLTRNLSENGVDLTTKVQGRLNNGTKISAISSFEKLEQQELVITGELATISSPGDDAFTSWNKSSSLEIGSHVEEFAPADPYRLMIENFGGNLLGETSWIPPIAQSLIVAKLMDQVMDFDK
jgi:predicted dehydrogenase